MKALYNLLIIVLLILFSFVCSLFSQCPNVDFNCFPLQDGTGMVVSWPGDCPAPYSQAVFIQDQDTTFLSGFCLEIGNEQRIYYIGVGNCTLDPNFQLWFDGVGCLYPGAVLPAELTSFSGSISGTTTTLEWVTATEQDVDQFVIQESLDPTLYWMDVGWVKATNSPTGSIYTFDKATPSTEAYYRLQIVDQDGSFEYSKVITLTGDYTADGPSYQIYHNLITFTEVVDWHIFDMGGRLIQSGRSQMVVLYPGLQVLKYGNKTLKLYGN